MQINKILAGITNNQELYFINMSNENYFSLSGDTVAVELYEDIVTRTKEYLEDGDNWRDAVTNESTELGLKEWADWVIEEDGEIADFDAYNNNEGVEVDGVTYLLEHVGAGQHQEKELAHYFIDKILLDNINKMWDTYHLKDINTNNATYNQFIGVTQAQDIDSLIIKSIKLINDIK